MFCLLRRVQLDNTDEQAAQVRRELDNRLSCAEEMNKVCFLMIIAHFHQWRPL